MFGGRRGDPASGPRHRALDSTCGEDVNLDVRTIEVIGWHSSGEDFRLELAPTFSTEKAEHAETPTS